VSAPSTIYDLSSVIGSNSPSGSESPRGVVDDYFRAGFGLIAQLQTEATAASASTVDMSAIPEGLVNITGTTTITSFGTVRAGIVKFVRFSGALSLTYNASTFILPGSASITTVAGDTAMFVSMGSGVWRCYAYSRADGTFVGNVQEFRANYGTSVSNLFGSNSTTGYGGTYTSHPYIIKTANTEAARFNTSQNLLIGTSTDFTNPAKIMVSYNGATYNGITLRDNSGTNPSFPMRFDRQDGTSVGNISISTTATAYNTSSDARLKKNIQSASDVGEVIDRIGICTYDWMYTGQSGFGVIAQELQPVVPEAVNAGPDGFLGVDYSKLVPYLVKEVQSLRRRLKAAGV
jgi:hypothetical protein